MAGRPVDFRLLASEIDRLQRLTADLMLLADGYLAVGDNAPILDNWIQATRPAICFAGEVSGHPLLPGKERQIITSDVWVIAEEMSCVRTLSRWYRLGRPFGCTQPS